MGRNLLPCRLQGTLRRARRLKRCLIYIISTGSLTRYEGAMTGAGTRGFLIRQFVRILAVAVCLSVLLAGFAVLEAPNSFHGKGISSADITAVSASQDCSHSTGKKPGEHGTHGICDGCLNCITFAAAAFEPAVISAPSSGFAALPARKLANRIIIPPSPPPKLFVLA